MEKITKDTIIAEVLNIDINLAQILMSAGMHCIGCPSAQGESIGEACTVHGIDADGLVESLNAFLTAAK